MEFEMDDFLDLTPKNIPDRQQCVIFENRKKSKITPP